MGISLERQLFAVLYAVLTGAVCGVLFDGIRILRVFFGISCYTRGGRRLYALSLPLIGAVRPPADADTRRVRRLVFLAVGDLLFAGLAGCAFCIFLFHAASGCFRWFYLLGCGIGFAVYYATVGKLVMLSSELLTFCLRAVLRYVLWIFIAPFRAVQWLLRRFGRFLHSRVVIPIVLAMRQRYRIRYTRRVRAALPDSVKMTESDWIDI